MFLNQKCFFTLFEIELQFTSERSLTVATLLWLKGLFAFAMIQKNFQLHRGNTVRHP